MANNIIVAANIAASKKRYAKSKAGREAQRRYRQSPKGKAACKRHQFTQKGKISSKHAERKYRKKYPEILAARNSVKKAVKRGILPRIKTLTCRYCPEPAQEYHHWNYDKEFHLDVIGLCKKCHNEITYKKSPLTRPTRAKAKEEEVLTNHKARR